MINSLIGALGNDQKIRAEEAAKIAAARREGWEACRERAAGIIEATECYGGTPEHPGVCHTSSYWRKKIAAAIRSLPYEEPTGHREQPHPKATQGEK